MRKVLLALVLFGAAFAADMKVASANTASATADCSGVTFNYVDFPDGSTPITETVQVDGTTVATNVHDQVGAEGSDTIPLSLQGPHTVTATATWEFDGPHEFTQDFPLSCPSDCVPGTPNAAGAHASGDAFGASVKTPILSVSPRPTAKSSQTGVGANHQDNTLLSIGVPAVATINLLTASSTATVLPDAADDISVAETASVNLFGGVIKADAVRGVAEAIARGDSSATTQAGSTFAGLTIGGVPYVNVAPNTKVYVPTIGTGAYVILNERVTATSGPAPGVLSGGTYTAAITVNMIHVYVPGIVPGLTPVEVIVSHATAHADFPQTPVCPTRTQTVSGHAFVASVFVPGVGNTSVVQGLSAIPPTGGSSSQSLAAVNVPGLVGAGVASSSSTGTLNPTNSTASSKASIANVSLLGGVITATAVQSQSNSTANGASRSSDATGTQLLGLVINGTPIAANPPPNTVITLPGIGFVILNEQIPDAPATGHTGLTVRSIHVVVTLPVPLVVGTDVIVSEAHSDATF